MAVEFRLLGTVEARADGQPVDLGHARQQCVLVALLVKANKVLSADQLLDRVWGDHVPRRGRDTLYSYLSRLRKALADADEITLRRQSGGYVLAVPSRSVDLHRFRDLVGQARTAGDDRALGLFEQALGLWRGEAFAGLDTDWLTTVRAEFDAERLAAKLDHTDVALRLGQHAALLPTLSTLADERLLDERLAGQLMLALYRSGRPAEAQEHYQRVRSRLVEQLGTDPSQPLRELHQRILTADPALALPSTPRLPDTPGSVVPRQLPAPPRGFTGRTRELTALNAAADTDNDAMMISVIAGALGVGKTWLALHWAHRNIERFPDGQLFVDLRGFSPDNRPMLPKVAMRGFFDAFGVDPDQLPVDPHAQAARYRSLVANKRMLIVLDNASDTTQVAALLPGTPTCMVLVTSRRHLSGLIAEHGAGHLSLDALSDAEARALLVTRLGAERVAAEPAAINDLVACCGRIPLALSIIAGRAHTHPHLPLATLTAELRDAGLDTFEEEDRATILPTVLS
jgi:DNA-binding SARP family transcriptional activator